MPSPPRRILLVDADAFFVAVARMADPEGAGRAKLLIVGGSREGRGVVCSASYDVRAFGVRSGMPMARAVKLCPQAMCVPVPRGACSEKSREIRAELERWAPVVEGASIDEWYLDLAGTEALYGHEPLAETARRIREAVVARTGLTVSIGGGTNKLVAKLAVELAKPKYGAAGVHVVPPGGEGEFMRGIELAAVPGIGPRFQERLRRDNLVTVADVLALDAETLVRLVGERDAEWLLRVARGEHEGAVEAGEEAKSISREETFPRDIHDDPSLERELVRVAVRVAADVREEGLRARTITVKLRDADFTTRRKSRTLPEGVESERAIVAVALDLLRRLRAARRVGTRLVGVALTGFGAGPARQLGLFESAAVPVAGVESERDRALSRAADALRAKFGPDAILPGTLVE
ncbi:MAG TPA: DNA polymerase IV [Gemmatimonadaceae bacterium]